MALVLTHLEKAVGSLERGLAQPKDEFTRDSVIQRFEYTYELAWKLMLRTLDAEIGVPGIAGLPRRELYRLAAQHSLIDNPVDWFEFHQARNLTAHTYNEATAEEVYEVAAKFLPAVGDLLARLRRFA